MEDGYTDEVALLGDRTGAADGLQRFLGAVLEALGPPSERERFFLIGEPVEIQFPHADKAFDGAPEISLQDYLDQLNARSDDPVDISDCLGNPCQMQRWQRKTARVMTEMVGFLRRIDNRPRVRPGRVPVPLLRDTLPICLGLTWLGGNLCRCS